MDDLIFSKFIFSLLAHSNHNTTWIVLLKRLALLRDLILNTFSE